MDKFSSLPTARGCRRGLLAFAIFWLAGCNLVCHSATSYVPQSPAEPYPALQPTTNASLAQVLDPLTKTPPRTQPINVLAICAGGVNSPFNAGALVGWTQAGTRPTFDVVTGTSSGALVGAFAFLGPKYDAKLQTLFTEVTSADLFRVRPVRYLLLDKSIASSKPLERLLQEEINESYLADLREAHAQGRRLFIGTTNFDTKRLVVWDLGAIASSGRPDAAVLVRKILQATVTWPGLLPPVEFKVLVNGQWCREQHYDGGAGAQCFVRLGPTAGWPEPGEPAPGWMAGSNLYVLAGGKLYADPRPTPNRFFGRVLTGTSCLIYSLARADMNRLHTQCLGAGMRFHLLAVPEDYHGTEQSLLDVDRAEICRLFQTGYRLTSSSAPWRHTPPGAEPGEEETPRGMPNCKCQIAN